LDRTEGGTEMIGGVHKWIMPSNWKFAPENFGGDGYHIGWTHLSALKTGFGSVTRIRQAQEGTTGFPGNLLSPGTGHCIISREGFADIDPPIPEIYAYEESIRSEVRQRMGERSELSSPIVGTIFPNLSFIRTIAREFRVWHPRGPTSTEIWSWSLVDKAAPPEIKDAFRLAALRTFSPGGTFEQDDMENWQYCTDTSRIRALNNSPMNFQMGLKRERFREEFGALASDYIISETTQRGFYDFWGKIMAAEKWDQIDRSPYSV
ncbi:MAG TPA: RHO alpha subunit C-terminal catalytic domain-containing protein, partial [Dehalococcoidia bacterium]|nr:RHO alpha subunit C-terminal catalytic domain-containing protein [Dehalococcoidia bacterium]